VRPAPEELVTIPLIERRPTKTCSSGSYKYGRLPEHVLHEELRGKRIIIVGPAGYLQGQGKGSWIDSFDVVIRINHAIPVKYPKDYGKRTDVLYHILSHRSEDGIHKKLVERSEIETWVKHGLKWLVSRHESLSRRVRQMETVIDGLIPWITIHRIFYRKMANAISRKNPNTGLVAIMHLLSMPIKSLQVVGFDFYRSGVYTGYGEIRANESAAVVNSQWHDNQAQIEYLRKVKARESRLFFDEVLTEICER